ncbi:outer membrane lipid asymmetry maintenance protein MlaD [Sphingomonas sp. ID0503]|uniref:outer membrane lipid asymmetry maintenance protein MlaD n=1 Tax=Sphingomonas sp. ID0503 TaxID=3399691 RepID=UPI003AFA8892
MRSLFRENAAEAVIGLLVVVVGVWFAVFAWNLAGGSGKSNAIHVNALFPSAGGVNVGTDVRIAGMNVGTVTAQRLDPKSFQAELTLAIDKDVKVPADSSAAITSEGIMGGTYIALVPGGEETPLKDGDTILDTQGSVDMMGLIGQFVNKTGDAPKADATGEAPQP